MTSTITNENCYFRVPLHKILEDDEESVGKLQSIFGTHAMEAMMKGLKLLLQKFPLLEFSKSAFLIGPTVEGVGCYPTLDNNLKIDNLNCWVAGDASGIFRGYFIFWDYHS